MSIRKAKIVLFSERQKDDMLERLERSKVEYRIREVSNLFTFGTHFDISVNAADMKKVV